MNIEDTLKETLIDMIKTTLALEELLPDEEGAAVRTIRRQLDQLLGRMGKRWTKGKKKKKSGCYLPHVDNFLPDQPE